MAGGRCSADRGSLPLGETANIFEWDILRELEQSVLDSPMRTASKPAARYSRT